MRAADPPASSTEASAVTPPAAEPPPVAEPSPVAESSSEVPLWLDEEEQVAWRDYLRGTAQVMDVLDRELHPFGTTLSEYEILAMLSEAPRGRLRMAVLADTVVQSRSRLTHTAGRLEARGWVVRHPAENDRRGIELALTRSGRRKVKQLAEAHVASVRKVLLDPIGRADFLALGAALARVREALER